MARIGVFGGSFNPPHCGHILAIEEFQQKLKLDKVMLVPAGIPPHKKLTGNSPSPQARLEMCRLAAADLPYLQVLDNEIRREGSSYTADTLRELREQYPEDEFFLLMGTDMFLSFDQWHQPEQIAAMATLAVAHRCAANEAQLTDFAKKLEETMGARTIFVENRFLPHSSTSVRAMLAFRAGETFVPASVMDYIQKNHLYYCDADLKNLPFDLLSQISLSLLNPKRVAHVQGCSRTAGELAEKYGVSVRDAERAGMLHDVTKALNGEEQLKLCEKYGIILSSFQRDNPKLLHAVTGAAVAGAVFGENEPVCQAIRWHTTGKVEMSTLEKIIYLADYMEPNRCFDGVEELRSLVWKDLDEAMLLGLRMTMEQILRRGREVDPNSLAALQFLEERKSAV